MLHPVSIVHQVRSLNPDLVQLPDAPGVYAFYVSDRRALPGQLAAAVQGAGAVTLYVGKTGDSLRGRLRQHLYGDARVSSLRANFGVLAQEFLDLILVRIAGKRYFAFKDETPIDEWIVQNLDVGLLETADPTGTEAEWLRNSPGILNLSGRPSTPLTTEIRRRRSLASGRHIPQPRR